MRFLLLPILLQLVIVLQKCETMEILRRLISRTDDPEHSANPEERMTFLREKIKRLENELAANIYGMSAQRRCRKAIEIAVTKMRLELELKIEWCNSVDALSKAHTDPDQKELLQKETESLIKAVKHLDSCIFVYRRASMSLNVEGELEVNSAHMDLKEPRYSNALIQFIAESADLLFTRIRMGTRVEYPNAQNYNFFEELIEELADTRHPEKVVKEMEFSLNKKEQMKDFEALLGPNGVLRHSGVLLRTRKIGVDGIIEPAGVQKVKKGFWKSTMMEKLYRVSNLKTEATFEVRLVYSEHRKKFTNEKGKQTSKSPPPKLLSLTISNLDSKNCCS